MEFLLKTKVKDNVAETLKMIYMELDIPQGGRIMSLNFYLVAVEIFFNHCAGTRSLIKVLKFPSVIYSGEG